VTSKFLSNHNLKDNYTQWIMSKPVAKYTGYVFELAKKLRDYGVSAYSRGRYNLPIEVKHTIDSQFMGLVEKARENGKINTNVWCALDTSGSMNARVSGLKDITCEDIASSLAVFFGELNTGAFHNKIIMFDNVSHPYDMKGDSFCDRIANLPAVPAGGTNFQSIVEEIVKIREQHPEIPLEDYPQTILVVSDMQFNPVSYSWYSSRGSRTEPTNYEYSKNTLKKVFPAEFVDNMKFIWCDCAARYGNTDYEASASTNGAYFFSGFDGSIISILLGENDAEEKVVVDEETGEEVKVKVASLTAEELAYKALNQEILSYLTI
jgi:hypothetical protein